MKKKNKSLEKILKTGANTYEDKLAILKYISKNNTSDISSAVLKTLKKE